MKLSHTLFLLISSPVVCAAQPAASNNELNLFSKEELSNLISQVEEKTGVNINEFISRELFPELDEIDDNSMPVSQIDISNMVVFEPFNVDYGYLVKDAKGLTVDAFGPNTPVILTDKNTLSIEGFDAPVEGSIVRVGAGAYNEALLDVVKRKAEEIESDTVNSQVMDVSRRATRATFIIATDMCVSPVYPSEVKLFMNAGFDFVLVKSDTGSELTLIMSEICQNFYTFIVDELDKMP